MPIRILYLAPVEPEGHKSSSEWFKYGMELEDEAGLQWSKLVI